MKEKQNLTASEMGKKSWEARKKRHGEKKLQELMQKASELAKIKRLTKV